MLIKVSDGNWVNDYEIISIEVQKNLQPDRFGPSPVGFSVLVTTTSGRCLEYWTGKKESDAIGVANDLAEDFNNKWNGDEEDE